MAKVVFGKVKEAPKPKRSRRHRHSTLYETYMKSEAWRALREEMISFSGGLCDRCVASEDEDGVRLEVHHLTYERLGHEDLDDLQVLCPPCHVLADKEREEETKGNAEFNRLDGWANKVYGSDWMWNPGTSEAEDAFAEWLERRR